MPVIPSPSPPPPRPAPASPFLPFPVCTHNYCMCVGPPAPPFLPSFPHLPSFICRLRPLLPPTNFVVRIELNPVCTPQNRQKKNSLPTFTIVAEGHNADFVAYIRLHLTRKQSKRLQCSKQQQQQQHLISVSLCVFLCVFLPLQNLVMFCLISQTRIRHLLALSEEDLCTQFPLHGSQEACLSVPYFHCIGVLWRNLFANFEALGVLRKNLSIDLHRIGVLGKYLSVLNLNYCIGIFFVENEFLYQICTALDVFGKNLYTKFLHCIFWVATTIA